MISFIEIDKVKSGIVTIRVDNIRNVFVSNKKIHNSEDEHCGITLSNGDNILINETYDQFLQRIAQGKIWISTLG